MNKIERSRDKLCWHGEMRGTDEASVEENKRQYQARRKHGELTREEYRYSAEFKVLNRKYESTAGRFSAQSQTFSNVMCCQTVEVQPHASLSARVTAELHAFDHDMFLIGRMQATGLDLIYAL
jgi:hypothetical protein